MIEHASSFMKQLLKKQCVYRNTKYCLFLCEVIIQTNKLFIFRGLLNFTTECIGGQIKAFSCVFCTTSDAKSTKGREC